MSEPRMYSVAKLPSGRVAIDRGFEQAVMMAAGVAAERLWSPRTTLDVQDARHRLGTLRTKLSSRGYNAAPLPPVKSDDC